MTELTPDNINDPAVSLSWSNLRLLCRDCHAKRHARGVDTVWTGGASDVEVVTSPRSKKRAGVW